MVEQCKLYYISRQVLPSVLSSEDIMSENEAYYADLLKMEDLKGKWRLYWASLNVTGLYFYSDKSEQNNNFLRFIELTPGSRCVLAKRQMYSFRFKLTTEKGSYTLKCDTVLQRYRWMYMINLIVNGRPREQPPNALNPALINCLNQHDRNSIEEVDSSRKPEAGMKSRSVTRSFSFRNMWKKRSKSLTKKENPVGEREEKALVDPSVNCADNLAYFED